MLKIPKIILLIESSRMAGTGFLRGIAKYSAMHGPWTFFRNPPFYMEPRNKHQLSSRLKQLNPDGIIMTECNELGAIAKLGVPMVVSMLTKRQIPPLPTIVSNNEKIGVLAAQHFLSHGFQRFAFCGFDNMFWSSERGRGFDATVTDAGYKVVYYLRPISKQQRWEQEQLFLINWLKSLPKPIALMTCNDDRALQVFEACHMAQINIPEEIAIVGVDNDPLICDLSNPQLSSVALNFERAGYEAAELIAKFMAGKVMNNQIVTLREMFVVTRQSSDILAMEDQEVAKAVRFIRQNSRRILQISDVISTLPVSRRSLELRFRKIMGRSINEEIRRVRVEHAAQMLIETNMSIAEIASALGYNGFEHIARYFRQEKGMSPQSYRKQHGRR